MDGTQFKITFPTLLLMILMMKSVSTRLKIRRLERRRKKTNKKRSNSSLEIILLIMSGALLRPIFLSQGSLFEDQCPFSLDSQACPARDFQSDASPAGNQTTEEKTAQSSNPINRIKRESDLVQDKYSLLILISHN